MKKHAIALLVLLNVAAFGRVSLAIPFSAQLTLTDASQANLFVSTLGGSVTALVPFDLTGTLDITLEGPIAGSIFDPWNTTTGISLDDAAIALSDDSFNLSLGFLGGVSGAITGGGINTLNSNGYIDLPTTVGTNPFEYKFDPGGGSPTELSIDQGLFTYNGTGPVGGLLGSGTIDFSSDPVGATLAPIGQIGLVTQDVVAQIAYYTIIEVVVSAPLTFTDTIVTDPVTVDVDLSGALVATGYYSYYVPEPSTLMLLSIAIVALIPLRRRLMGK